MMLVAQILSTYNEIDTIFLQQFNSALNSGNRNLQISISEKRIFTDNAFFVLLWGQLENEINTLVRAMIDAGQADGDFKKRRLHYNLEPDRMKFEDRLAMVVDKNAGRGSAWNMAMTYYGLRNNIAHGTSNRSGISAASVAQDLYAIQSQFVP